MAIPPFDVAVGLRSNATFTNLDGVPTDPTNITYQLRSPSKHITDVTVFRTGTGMYFSDFVTQDEPGIWEWQWKGTGAVQAVEQGKFYVRTSDFA